MINLLSYLDYYCERTAPGLFNEPLNLFSNGAFFLAAFYIQELSKRKNFSSWRLNVLINLCYTIGVGSALFHSFANLITVFADVIPIALFVGIAVWFVAKSVFNFSRLHCFIAIAGLVMLSVLSAKFLKIPIFNGSEMYFGPLVTLIVMFLYASRKKIAHSSELAIATLVFACSILVRIVDLFLCPYWPLGTHFVWHLLNGFTLLFVMRFYLLASSSESESKR